MADLVSQLIVRLHLRKVWQFALSHNRVLTFFLTLAVIVLSLVAAFLLRFDFEIGAGQQHMFSRILLPAIAMKLAVFWVLGLNRGWWRYASLADVLDIAKATFWSSIGLTLFLVFVYRLEGVPRSVLILDAGLTFVLMAGIRFVSRIVREQYLPLLSLNGEQERISTLIIGAGESGQTIVRDIRKSGAPRRLVGYLDDDPTKQRSRFQGLPVLGTTASVETFCAKYEVEEIIIAIPVATAEQMRRIVELSVGAGARVTTLPAISDLINSRVSVKQIRDVDVRDLLGRRQVNLDVTKIEHYIKGKDILVTGAAGSIGAEICRQLTRFSPGSLALVDIAESPLFFVEREIQSLFSGPIHARIADVRDPLRMEAVFADLKPLLVFHAAAYKHVPMMEHNPSEAVSTNVHGTRVVADLASQYGTELFVMISTDKAVNPTNVMGASKRCAEIYVQSLNDHSQTRFSTVRFGNVLDSAGSVIPIFKQQILQGGPVTVTDPEVTRFFMTIPEATQLVLQAGSMGVGGEIFLLDMGEPVKILDLAEELIHLSGFAPGEDIKIEFTGLRPGEKLHEELLLAGEDINPTEHDAIRVTASQEFDFNGILENIEALYRIPHAAGKQKIIEQLKGMVPEFTPMSNSSP
jgi:FlaA1/EpsC-like NDP-sugar epimerase